MIAEDTAERLTQEGLITLTAAAKIFAQRPSAATLWRWHRTGAANGVRLEVVRCGRRFFTSRAAVVRFIAGQDTPRADEPDRSEKQRRESMRRAEEYLESKGVK